MVIKPYNVIDQTHLPEISVDQIPADGDPLEIAGEGICDLQNCDEMIIT
jgi:hypothetical protein